MVTYCQPSDIAAILQLMEKDGSSRVTFDDQSKPTLSEIEDWIEEEEDWIDDYTLDSWRPVSIPKPEYHRGERRGNVIGYGEPRAHVVYLTHNSIVKPLDSESGDTLEIAQNISWFDLLADGTEGDVYGHGDFFIDPDKGRIYIYGKDIKIGPGTIRVTYRHGQSSVIRPIKRACTLLTAMRFLSSDDYINLFPDNPNNIQLQAKYVSFKTEAYEKMNRHRRVITI